MPGIAGLYGDEPSTVDRILDTIAYRGPHGKWRFDEGLVHLGIRELNVGGVGKENSHFASDGKTAVIVDGRVYNEGLEDLSDAESILALYDHFGDRFAEKIDGDFACALSDHGSLILTRDEAGIKPLYYGHDEKGNLCFASEAKALVDIAYDVREFPPVIPIPGKLDSVDP